MLFACLIDRDPQESALPEAARQLLSHAPGIHVVNYVANFFSTSAEAIGAAKRAADLDAT